MIAHCEGKCFRKYPRDNRCWELQLIKVYGLSIKTYDLWWYSSILFNFITTKGSLEILVRSRPRKRSKWPLQWGDFDAKLILKPAGNVQAFQSILQCSRLAWRLWRNAKLWILKTTRPVTPERANRSFFFFNHPNLGRYNNVVYTDELKKKFRFRFRETEIWSMIRANERSWHTKCLQLDRSGRRKDSVHPRSTCERFIQIHTL